jgi:hypothetical protein
MPSRAAALAMLAERFRAEARRQPALHCIIVQADDRDAVRRLVAPALGSFPDYSDVRIIPPTMSDPKPTAYALIQQSHHEKQRSSEGFDCLWPLACEAEATLRRLGREPPGPEPDPRSDVAFSNHSVRPWLARLVHMAKAGVGDLSLHSVPTVLSLPEGASVRILLNVSEASATVLDSIRRDLEDADRSALPPAETSPEPPTTLRAGPPADEPREGRERSRGRQRGRSLKRFEVISAFHDRTMKGETIAVRAIAEEVGCSASYVSKILRKLSSERRDAAPRGSKGKDGTLEASD